MRAVAHAKVNLSLRVGSLRSDGYHPIVGLFQSVSLADRLELDRAGEDGITGWQGGPVPDGDRNIAWQAVVAVRREVGGGQPVALRLEKRIPVAAGLGGGSADAAAALHLAARFYDAPEGLVAELAPLLGSDVPFCVIGGTALVSGRGEIVDPIDPIGGYTLALVVPPVEMPTRDVYRTWDALDGPSGPELPAGALPPALRAHSPFVNDLYPAAVAIAAELDGWREELAGRWRRPVAMSGSGPTLMAFFVDEDEAAAALREVPPGARSTVAAMPVSRGWALEESE